MKVGVKLLLMAVAIIFGLTRASQSQALTFTTLDAPLGVHGTVAEGIYGNTVVGYYYDSAYRSHGFIYDGATYTTLNAPSGIDTFAYGVYGNNVLGSYLDAGTTLHGYLYDGSTYTIIDHPLAGAMGTAAVDMDGGLIIGTYIGTPSYPHGFTYDGSTFTSDNDTSSTFFYGVEGNNIVGASDFRAFIYDGSTYTTIPDPAGGENTVAADISGGMVVGYYDDLLGVHHGFYYDGLSHLIIDHPLAGPVGTVVLGIDGNMLVGYYTDADGLDHGFITQIPEPSTVVLLGIGATALIASFTRRRATSRRG